jgi:prolyl-tRNA synthetase
MQRVLDDMFKATGHQNAYFPLLIPLSYIEREKEHVKGFAPEVAVVTHAGGKELEEPLVIRPTSETIIYSMFAKWVQSYRDLPLLINQWSNVVRWELRTRLFLRTSEFLWQEGHTAHVSEGEAEEETLRILALYRTFMEDWMAMPPLTGRKTDSERFAGALRTYACEALMQDNRALQAGTSHNLGQNFARQFDLRFQTETGTEEYAWNTSWGVSTRLVGGLIMTHGDDAGLIVPPRLAPVQVVIVPIYRSDDDRARVLEKAERVEAELRASQIRTKIDARDTVKPGSKYYEWERKGVPARIEIGPRDVDQGSVMVVMRSTPTAAIQRKEPVPDAELASRLRDKLETYQAALLETARERREANSHRGIRDYGEFHSVIDEAGGFVYAGWCGSEACEAKVKEDTKATIRVLPSEEFASSEKPAACMVCGAPAVTEAVWARAY